MISTERIACKHGGGHIDVYVDAAEAAGGRILVRVPGDAALGRAPVGARVRIATTGVSSVAFPPGS